MGRPWAGRVEPQKPCAQDVALQPQMGSHGGESKARLISSDHKAPGNSCQAWRLWPQPWQPKHKTLSRIWAPSNQVTFISLLLNCLLHFFPFPPPTYIFHSNLSKTDLEFLASGMLPKIAYSENLLSINIPIYKWENMIAGAADILNLFLFVCLFDSLRDRIIQCTQSFQIWTLVLESWPEFLKPKEFTLTEISKKVLST